MKQIFIMIFLFYSVFLFSITIEIPIDYPTIQQGIDNSNDGDVVLIHPGTYYENLFITNKNIVITSLFYTTHDSTYIYETVIDGNNTGIAVSIDSCLEFLLSSLTIQNGYNSGYGSAGCGSGVKCDQSIVKLQNLIIHDNFANIDGAGIYSCSSEVLIVNCTIFDNQANDDGGGICAVTSSILQVNDCNISLNTCGDEGGGFISTGSTFTIFNNCILDNNTSGDNGGGLYLTLSSMEMYYSIVSNNNSIDGAGGLDLWDADAIIDKSVFCLNSSHIYSGGISAFLSSELVLSNTIVAHNIGYGLQGNCDVTYCDFYNNSSGNFYECGPNIGNIVSTNFNGDPCDIFKNIIMDPCFSNYSMGDFHLNPYSPCIDAGDPDFQLDPDGSYTDIGKFYCDQANFILANFEASPLTGYVPLEVHFTDLSTGNITNWEWDFDNNGVIDSYEQNPDYTYILSGIYTVKLSIFNDTSTDSEVKIDYINIAGPFAEFEASPLNGYVPLEVQFTDLSAGNIISWEWDFNNDGVIDSYEQNPAYTYSDIGNISVSLHISDGTFLDTETKFDYIEVYGPSAMFNADITYGYAPLEVQFTDLSLGNISNWEWDFNNDGIIDSYEQNPIYIYSEIDTFSVCLFAYSGAYSDEYLIENYVITNEHVNCDFTANPTNGSTPLSVQFTDISTGAITSRQWDFNNDGIIDSYEHNPTCTYYNPGFYSVYLLVSDGEEEDSELKLEYINVTLTGTDNLPEPESTKLIGNFPNPFNPSTLISFDVKESESAELSIYNLKGQIIYNSLFSSGHHNFSWNASALSSGIYFYSLISPSYRKTNKMNLLK